MMIIFLIGRVIFGGYFVYSAYGHFKNLKMMAGYSKSKGIPMPEVAVIGTGILLLLGGLGLIFGLFVKIALLFLILFIVGVTPTMHAFWKITDPMHHMTERVSFMKNIAILGALLMLLSLWPGM